LIYNVNRRKSRGLTLGIGRVFAEHTNEVVFYSPNLLSFWRFNFGPRIWW